MPTTAAPSMTSHLTLVTDSTYDLTPLELTDIHSDYDTDLEILNTGSGWLGTKMTVIRALIDDLLPEGPFQVILRTVDHISDVTTVTGHLVGFEQGDLHIATKAAGIPLVVAVPSDTITFLGI